MLFRSCPPSAPRLCPTGRCRAQLGIAALLWVCIGVGLVLYFFSPGPGPVIEPAPPTPVQPVPIQPDPPEPAQRLYPDMPAVERVEYYPLPEPSRRWMLYAALALLSLLATMGYGVHLHRARKVPEDRPAQFNKGAPRHFSLAGVGGPRAPLLDDETLDQLADSMGYFRSERPGRRVDAGASVAATVRNLGIPRIVFQRQKQVRALLVLEDRFAEHLAWNTMAAELARGMAPRGVPVIHGHYEGAPDPFRLEDGTVVHLEDLEDRRRGILVLVFSDRWPGHGEGRAHFALERLARWPMVAWLRFEGGSGRCEVGSVKFEIPIPTFPATPEGIRAAIGGFLTERAHDSAHDSRPPPGDAHDGRYDRRNTAPGAARLDARLEQLLGDALPWARDCALLQPIPPGLADALRREFYPHLPPERLGRLFALPDTRHTPSGLRFSAPVLDVLRGGFEARHPPRKRVYPPSLSGSLSKESSKAIERDSDNDSDAGTGPPRRPFMPTPPSQEAIRAFIGKALDKARPTLAEGEAPGLAYLKWEMAKERLRLDAGEAGNDLARLAELEKSPLGPALVADLEERPPRHLPANPKARQRLASLPGNPLRLRKLKAFPLTRPQKALAAALVLCCVGFAGKGVVDWRGARGEGPVDNFEIVSELVGELPLADIRLERRIGDDWEIVGDRDRGGWLPENTDHRLVLYGNGHRTIREFTTRAGQGTRLHMARRDEWADCREERREIGLTVVRCGADGHGVDWGKRPLPKAAGANPNTDPRHRPVGVRSSPQPTILERGAPGKDAIASTAGRAGLQAGKMSFRQGLAEPGARDGKTSSRRGSRKPASRDGNTRLTVALELSDRENVENPTLTALGEALWKTGRLDLLYRVRPTESGAWELERVFEEMETDLAPWIKSSRLLWWRAAGALPWSSRQGMPGPSAREGEKQGMPGPGARDGKQQEFPEFARTVALPVESEAAWRGALAEVFGSEMADKEAIAATVLVFQTFRDRLRDGGLGPGMMVLPAGKFMMGSPEGEEGRDSNEGPRHPVRIPEPFALGMTEVTVTAFRGFVEGTGYRTSAEQGDGCYGWTGSSWERDKKQHWRNPGFEQGGDHPVACVDWHDAVAYAEWLSGQTGEDYRLPTEAEWEYAARAGTDTPFSTGECIHTDQANYDGNYDYAGCGAKTGVYRGKTVPAGSLPANPWGLHGMHGNVWEWTADCWHGDYENAPEDGRAWGGEDGGDCGWRVDRGGSWGSGPRVLRSANRYRFRTNGASGYVGFRLARAL